MTSCGHAAVLGRKTTVQPTDVLDKLKVVELGERLLNWVERQEELNDAELRQEVTRTICAVPGEWTPYPLMNRDELIRISMGLTVRIEEILNEGVRSEESPRT
jgi:hypothetical protein